MSQIVISVALLPPDEIVDAAREANRRLWQESRFGFVFDETHLPHLTLAQLFLDASRFSDVEATVDAVARASGRLQVELLEVRAYPSPMGIPFSEWTMRLTPDLLALHEQVITGLDGLRDYSGTAEAFYGGVDAELVESHIRYVEQFAVIAGGARFRPHITLGAGTLSMKVPFDSFRVSRMAVCHLGQYWTCRRVLHENRLGT